MKLSLEDIYAWDENAAWLGMNLDILMENAGSAVARAIHQRYGYDEKEITDDLTSPSSLAVAITVGTDVLRQDILAASTMV